MKKWHWFLLIVSFTIAVLAAVSYYWPKLKIAFFKPNVIEFATIYKVESLTCGVEQDCSIIRFRFSAAENSLRQTPQYTIKEIPEEAKAQIIFGNVQTLDQNCTYEA